MKIIPTFATRKHTTSNLWTACYSEHSRNKINERDIFSVLFKNWNDTQFLQDFFIKNQKLLKEFRGNMTVDNAIDLVLDESLSFEVELKGIEYKLPGYSHATLSNVFKQLDVNEFALRQQTQNFRKGKPNTYNPLLRLYAIELDEECFVLTGGGIKIALQMNKDELINKENDKLRQVQDYLKNQGIYSKTALIDYYEQD